MNYNIYIKNIFLLVILITTGGCKKYLDLKPKGVDVVGTIDHYNGLFNFNSLTTLATYTAYEGGFSPGNDVNMSIMMSPETATNSPYSSNFYQPRYMRAYHWGDTIFQADENAGEWSAFYQLMYTYNVIANGVMNSPDGTEQKKKELLAEAKANRAFLYLMLVNYFGKPYNAATSFADPAVPLITIPDAAAASGSRASVQEVYDFIIEDLTEAIADLPEKTVNRLRLAKPAAVYLLGQVYFFQKKYDLALAQLETAKTLLENDESPMQLYDYNIVISQWQPDPNFPPNLPFSVNNEDVVCLRQVYLFNTNRNIFIDPAYVNYDPADLRLRFCSDKDFGGMPYPALTRTGPFSWNYGPSMTNLYLMMAECKARTNDITGATADLLYFREHRMPADAAAFSVTDPDELIRFIIEERYREFALTGFCWFDVRRLWDDPLFKENTYQHINETGTYTLTENRLTLKIPPKVININTDMVNNP